MIVIINGAPGAGKTFLLENLHKFKERKFVALKKYTTRYPRNFEKGFESIDLRYGDSKEHIQELEYNYDVGGKFYGIDKQEIEEITNRGEIPVIIIRSFEIIRKIKKDFEDVYVFYIVGATGDTLHNKLIEQGRAQKEILTSNSISRSMTNDYIQNISDIDCCILNSLYDPELYFEQFLTFTKIKHK